MAVTITGEREIALKFDQFPQQLRGRLEERITALTAALQARVEGARPVSPGKSGKLRTEIKARIYSSPNRVAGYVSVYASGGGSNEYAKAAALEYGSNKARKASQRGGKLLARLTSSRRRIVSRVSKPVHLDAYRYLRGSFDGAENEFTAAAQQALAEAVDEANGT